MYSLLKHLFFLLDPESAHLLVKRLSIPVSLIKPLMRVSSPRLKTTIGKKIIPHPVGLAAGFDKNAELLKLVEGMGFAFSEIGSITDQSYAGNPKPRIFRLPKDESLINRMGLPNQGAQAISETLARYKGSMVLGGNIAKSPKSHLVSAAQGVDEYVSTLKKIQDRVDYITVNLSCPNTSDGKTFEDPAFFGDLIREVVSVTDKSKPLLIKLSPDIEKDNLKKIVEMALKLDVNGFVLGNTSQTRENLRTNKKEITRIAKGGLSGRALKPLANGLLKSVYAMTGNHVILMGVGGIMTPTDAIDKILLGASHVQIYTGLIYNGPFFVKQIVKEMDRFCRRHQFTNYLEMRGRRELVDSAI